MLRLWLLACLGCSHKEPPPPRNDFNFDGGTLSSQIVIGDPGTLWQRLDGIYPIQEDAWAWTKPKFSVVLAPRRPQLKVSLYLAPPQMDQLKELTLRVRVHGVELAPETYRSAGQKTYVRPLDPKLLDGPVRVDFSVDDVYLPKPPDTRRLGIVVNSIAIEDQE